AGGHIGGLAELRVQDRHRVRRLAERLLDMGVVAFLRRRANETPEQAVDRGGTDRELPVHPAPGAGARLGVGGLERAGPVLAGEIAHDRVRFPEREAVVLFERRVAAVWAPREHSGLPG